MTKAHSNDNRDIRAPNFIRLKRVSPKANSSRWLPLRFEWQTGYGAFGVSASNRKKVASIENQEKHHKKLTFEDEFLAFLKAAGVDYDPRFVFG